MRYMVAILLLVGCSSGPRRAESPQRPSQVPVGKESGKEADKESPAVPTDLPKVGIIFGPGGMKTYSYIGVLRELERARIPIHSTIGIEWGAVIAGVYAATPKSNDLEWKMFKLKSNPSKKSGLLNFSKDRTKSEDFEEFFKDISGDKNISDLSLKFACPTTTLDAERTRWLTTGKLADALMLCSVLPPVTEGDGEIVAAPFSVAEAAKQLRSGGAEIVILVNGLAGGKIWGKTSKDVSPEARLLWGQINNDLMHPHEGIDFVIGVHTRDYDMMNFEARRSLVMFGSQSGVVAVKKLQEKFGF